MIARNFQDESAMEELMRKVSENRAKTIDRLVSDARAAKAESGCKHKSCAHAG